MNPFSLTPGSKYIIKQLYPQRKLFINDMQATFLRRSGNLIIFKSMSSDRLLYFTLDQNGKLLFNANDPETEVKLISGSKLSSYVDDPKLDRLEEVRKAMMSSGYGEEAVKLSSASYDSLASDRYRDQAIVQNDLQNQQKRRLRRYYNYNIIYKDRRENKYRAIFSRFEEPLISDAPTKAFFFSPNGEEFFLFLKDGFFFTSTNGLFLPPYKKVKVIGNLTFEEYENQQMQSEDERLSTRRLEEFDRMPERAEEPIKPWWRPWGGKSRRKRKCRKSMKSRKTKSKRKKYY